MRRDTMDGDGDGTDGRDVRPVAGDIRTWKGSWEMAMWPRDLVRWR